MDSSRLETNASQFQNFVPPMMSPMATVLAAKMDLSWTRMIKDAMILSAKLNKVISV